MRALVFPNEEAGPLERSGVEIRRGDFTHGRSLAGLCDGVDIVFHLAVMGRNNDMDASLARMDLGWKSRVSYEEAMDRIAGWVSKHYP